MPSPSLHPSLAWEFYTDSPLAGMAVARESRMVLAWDASHVVYLLDEKGKLAARWVSRQPIATASIAESGNRIAVALVEGRLQWFDAALAPGESRRAPTALALAVDPHGRFALLSATAGKSLVIDCFGRRAASFETPRPLLHLRFPMAAPLVVAASEAGWLAGLDLAGQVLWSYEAGVKVGGLAVTGSGSTVLAAGLSHGLLRVRGDGAGSDGTYRLENLPCRVDVTPAGDRMLAGSINHVLTLLDRDGRVQWSETLEAPIVDVALGPLGEQAWVGEQTGRIARLDLREEAAARSEGPARSQGGSKPATLCEPTWTAPLQQSLDQLASASLSLLDDTGRVSAFLADRKLRVFQLPVPARGKGPAAEPASANDAPIHTSEVLPGTGAMLRSLGGVTVVLTDRRLLCYDAGRNASAVFDARLAQPTHCELLGKGEMLVVLERDRVIRADVRGQQRWLKVLPEPLDQLVVFPGGIAMTNDTGKLEVLDLEGKPRWQFAAFRKESQLLAVSGELILVLGHTEKTLRAFRFDGTPAWECPVPFEPWRMFGVGRFTLVRSPDGSTLAVDPAGGRAAGAHPEVPQAWYFSLPDGRLGRVFLQAGSLSAADFAGRLLWRHVSNEDLGPLVVGKRGAAAILGSRLSWFPWAR